MVPCAVARPARFAACASPRLRSSVIASSMLPFASVSAALHSIMPAPVLSRSCFTIAAEISIVVIPVFAFCVLIRTKKAPARRPARDPADSPDLRAGGRGRFPPLRPDRRAEARGLVGGGGFVGARRIFLGDTLLAILPSVVDRVSDLRREQPDRPQRIVVPGDDVV